MVDETVLDAKVDELRALNAETRETSKRYVLRCVEEAVPVSRALVSFDCRVLGLEYRDESECISIGGDRHAALTEHIPVGTREHLAYAARLVPEHYSVSVEYGNIDEVVFRAPLELEQGDLIRVHVFTGENSVVLTPIERGYCVHPKRLDQLDEIVRAYRIDVLGDRRCLIGPRRVEKSFEDEQYMLGVGLKE